MPRPSRTCAAAALALIGLAPPADAATSILIKGSDTMMILAQRWAETYVRWYHCADIVVVGGGSEFGIASVLDGSADLGAVSRPLRSEEEKRLGGSEAIAVARDGVALFVNEANPIREISLADARKILTGAITNWSEIGGPDVAITIYGRRPGSGTAAFLEESLLGGQSFSEHVQSLAGSEAIVAAVLSDPSGVGYAGCAYVKGVRALGLRRTDGAPAIRPTQAAIAGGAYPLTRSLSFVTAKKRSPALQKFLTWVLSEEGQKVVETIGYVPIAFHPVAAGIAD